MRFKLIASAVGVLVLSVAAFATWYLVLRDDGPEEVSTDAALEALSARTPTAETPAATSTTAPASGQTPQSTTSGQTPQASTSALDGSWTIDTSLESFVGYRVQEELVGIGGATAVGRTRALTGGLTISGSKASAATITADMTKLQSNESLRDGQLRNQGIEYSKFPTATFALDETAVPVDVAAGKTTKMTLKGSLTLHGVTKPIEMPAEVTFKDGTLVVVGQVPILFSDYNISKPNAARVASIDENATMEVQLFFKKA